MAKLSDTKTKLVKVANIYADNQRNLLTTLAETSQEMLLLGSQVTEAEESMELKEKQLHRIRQASLAVIHASSVRRRLSKLLRGNKKKYIQNNFTATLLFM